ncbi:hypothetical protein EMGBD1_06230 [Anaerolineaceae bacterium]|nr:hypothetical protein EMGBD1_06230 [Anaerolineaceae bacterium]
MNTMQLLAQMEQWRNHVEPQLVLVTAAELLQSEAGDWSLLDKLAHLAAWDAEAVLALARVKQGGKPRYLNISPVETDKLNAQWLVENRGRPVERVLGDFQGVWRQLVRQVRGFAPADLEDIKRFPWLQGKSLVDFVDEWVLQHEREHLHALLPANA